MNRARDDLGRPVLTVTDLVCGGPVVVVAVVATTSLAWAHAHRFSLAAALLSALAVLAGLGALVRRSRVVVTGDLAGLVAVLLCGVVALVMFLPGFEYGAGDKDPGMYTAHGVLIAREGSYSFTDPALAAPGLPVVEGEEKARHPGVWIRNRETGLIVPQFFHLWPSLLATSYEVGGYGGIAATTPLVACAAVLALAGVLRRVAGVPAAVAGGLLLTTNMLEVWQAKFPSTEALAQALMVGALLWAVVAVQTRWRPASLLAGALVGVAFLNRPDGWLLVMAAAGILSALWVSRRADAEVPWAAAGLGVVLPYALFQAYGTAYRYSRDNGVPKLVPTLVLLGALVVAAVVLRPLGRSRVDGLLGAFSRPSAQLRAGLGVCAVFALLLVGGYLRPRLMGEDFTTAEGHGRFRTYDEHNLHRLTWFVTYPGMAMAGLGLAVVALRRWRLDAWALALPVLMLAPVFLWHAHVAVRLMWWGRRYVPYVLPGLVLLAALTVAFGVAFRWRGRPVLAGPAVIVLAAVLAATTAQSLPLRNHDEWAGAVAIAQRISDLSGDDRGVYLWEQGACCAAPALLFAMPVWMARGELSVLLPPREEDHADYVSQYRREFAGDPLFVVWDGANPLPADLRALGLSVVDHLSGTLPVWEETVEERPRRAVDVRYDMTVYRVP
jgi:hypothetical protein